MTKDFARGEGMMRRPAPLEGRQNDLIQPKKSSSQPGRSMPSWANQGPAWQTWQDDDGTLPPIPEHLKTNAWMSRYSGSADKAPSNQSPNPKEGKSVQPEASKVADRRNGAGKTQKKVDKIPEGFSTQYVAHPGKEPGTIILVEEGNNRILDNQPFSSNTVSQTDGFHGYILRNGRLMGPFKPGEPLPFFKPGDKLLKRNPPGTDAANTAKDQKKENPYEKMSYGDKLTEAAKMVPDLLKGDVKAAYQKMISDPAFVAQLVGASAAFAALQLTPAAPLVNITLITTLGFSAGFDLGSFLIKTGGAKDENSLKEAATHLKSLVETVGMAAIAGTLRTAGRLMAQLKKVQIAEAGTIRNVNPGGPTVAGRTHNCVNCSIATDATLKGRAASAMPGISTSTAILEKIYGQKFKPTKGADDIAKIMKTSGSSSHGIVWGRRFVNGKEQPGHVFNVVNQNGVIHFLDGQSGKAANLNDGYTNFWFMKTD